MTDDSFGTRGHGTVAPEGAGPTWQGSLVGSVRGFHPTLPPGKSKKGARGRGGRRPDSQRIEEAERVGWDTLRTTSATLVSGARRATSAWATIPTHRPDSSTTRILRTRLTSMRRQQSSSEVSSP